MTCKILKFVSIKFRDVDLNSHWQLMLFRGYKISHVFVKFSRILVKFAKCYTHEIQYEVLTDFIFRPMIFLRWWNFIKEIIHHVETGRRLKIKLLLQMKTVQCKKWDWWIIGELPRLLFSLTKLPQKHDSKTCIECDMAANMYQIFDMKVKSLLLLKNSTHWKILLSEDFFNNIFYIL